MIKLYFFLNFDELKILDKICVLLIKDILCKNNTVQKIYQIFSFVPLSSAERNDRRSATYF